MSAKASLPVLGGLAVATVAAVVAAEEVLRQAARPGISSIKKAEDFSLNARPWRPCR